MLLIEGTNHSDNYLVLGRARDILQRERWARRYGWARLETYLGMGDHRACPLPVTPGVGVVASGLLKDLARTCGENKAGGAAAHHEYRLACRELNAAGAACVIVSSHPDRDVHTPENYGVPIVGRVDPAGGDLEGAVREAVRAWGAHLDRAQTVAALNRGGWGGLWPRLLLVGERHHGADPLARPFGEDAGSAAYLSQLLDRADVAEPDVHFVNAHSATHGDLTWEGVAWLGARRVFAMGEVAAQHLRRIGVRAVRMPHPEYLRRFLPVEAASWATILRAEAYTKVPPLHAPAFAELCA